MGNYTGVGEKEKRQNSRVGLERGRRLKRTYLKIKLRE